MHKRSHFNDKDVIGHLREARIRGKKASTEDHETESPGYLASANDAAKETAVVVLLLSISFTVLRVSHVFILPLFGCFLLGWILWKASRSGIIGWTRLAKLYRLMMEEKHEIETNSAEEREELTAIYRAKGFTGELLDRVIDVLMSDDHKLLLVMLEEELGVNLENCDHPLKQALGAAIGTFLAICALLIGYLLSPIWGIPAAAYVVVGIASYVGAKIHRLSPLTQVIWNLGIVFLTSTTTYFFTLFIYERSH